MITYSFIIDTTVFNRFLRIKSANILHLLKNVCNQIIIPEEVITELSQYQNPDLIISINKIVNLAITNIFFRACYAKDKLVFYELSKFLGKGEAGAIAQSEKINNKIIITDDIECQNFIRKNYKHLKVFSSYYLIALLDVRNFIPDYPSVFKEFLSLDYIYLRNIKNKKEHLLKLRKEYIEACKGLGYYPNKKMIDLKTSPQKYLIV